MKKLGELINLHRELDRMFTEHQHALLHFEFGKALSSIERYEAALLAHMRDEEEVLLPVYRRCSDIPKGGDAKIFLDEHQKMRSFVEMFRERTAKLETEAEPETLLLTLLDRESFYKRLCGHHDKREHETLYSVLDDITSDEEKEDLLGRVTRTFETGTGSASG